MDETDEEWKKGVLADLIPAIAFLRKSFDDAHSACWDTTRRFCYALLHDEVPDDPAKEYLNWLWSMKARIGPVAARQFNDLIRANTPPAIFKAFHDLYVEEMSAQAELALQRLMEIGRAHEERLKLPFLEWAEGQAKHLIRSHMQQVENWIRWVCDSPIYDFPHDGDEEQIFWRKWQAPSLIIMRPSGRRPYDAEKVWDRNDAQTSSTWLKLFKDQYVLHLEINIRKLAGEAALALAKQPRPAQSRPTPKTEGNDPPQDRPLTLSTVRREARRLETQNKYKSWRRAYRKLVKNNPGHTDGWYSQKISQMSRFKGSNAETIRKRMKK